MATSVNFYTKAGADAADEGGAGGGATDAGVASLVSTGPLTGAALSAAYGSAAASANVLTLGVKGDVVTITDAAITTGTALLSRSGATKFSAADVGKKVLVVGAGTPANIRGAWAGSTAYAHGDSITYLGQTYVCGQAHTSHATIFKLNNWTTWPAPARTLHATILSVASGVATLNTNAARTVSGATCSYGTDDSAVVNALGAGDYYFPGERTYFLADWFMASHTSVTVGPDAIFKLPDYPTTDPAVFRLMTSNRTIATLLEDIHIYGRAHFDWSELTPVAGTNPRGVHVLNCSDWTIGKLHGRSLPGPTGNVFQVGANSGGGTATRGTVGAIRNDQVRGVGSSCSQHTGGTNIEYGPLTSDGGVAFRCEMDASVAVTDNVKVRLASVTNETGFANTAAYFVAHAYTMRNIEVGSILAEGGADGSSWAYDPGGSINDCTIRRMRVSGGGRATATQTNDLVLPGCTIYDARVVGSVASPALRETTGSLGAVGFALMPGMTLVNPRATGCADSGYRDIYSTTGVVAGSRATLVNPEATGNTGPGIYIQYLERVTVHGGFATDLNAAAAPVNAQKLPSNAYTGTLAGWSAATNSPTVSGAAGVLTVTATAAALNATAKTAAGTGGVAVTAGSFYKIKATAQPGTAPANSLGQILVWWSDAAGTFLTETAGASVAVPAGGTDLAYDVAAPTGAAFMSVLLRNFSNVGGGNLTIGWTFKWSNLAVQQVTALATQTYGVRADAGVTVEMFGTDLGDNGAGASVGAGTIIGGVGSTTIRTIVSLTQAAYDALTPDAATLYVVT